MSTLSLNLDNCARELIHIPGHIQSHGFIILVDDYQIIRAYSANASLFMSEMQVSVIGLPLSYLESQIKELEKTAVLTNLVIQCKKTKDFNQVNPYSLVIGEQAFNLVISPSGTDYLLEFEPRSTASPIDIQKMIAPIVTGMLGQQDLRALFNSTAIHVRKIIGYDRVMIYRFADDGHGEVIAEDKRDDLEPWLGFHYPASDIPPQARELYKKNLTRIIANVDTPSSPLLTSTNVSQDPCDLTYSQLRAVSPVHIQYLKNMGVASSYSISLIYKGELWGLIACHHYTPKFIDYTLRRASELIGQVLSSALEFRQEEKNQKIHLLFTARLAVLAKNLQERSTVAEALITDSTTMLDVTNANGAVLMHDGKISKLGLTPDDDVLNGLLNWLDKENRETLYYTSQLSSIVPAAEGCRETCSGMLAIVLSKELKEYLLWFKPQRVEIIKWAGNPDKPAVNDPDNYQHISPRNSFKAWMQTVTGKSESWSAEEIHAVSRLREEIVTSLNLKANALRGLHEQLREAYEELDTFGYTISHDLKNPITAIKGYASLIKSKELTKGTVETLAMRIEDRADKMNHMINAVLEYTRIARSGLAFSTINMSRLLQEMIQDLVLETERDNIVVTLGAMPELVGEPVMISQVFNNLIGNAVKYSRHANPGRVHIEGLVTETKITYSIADNGLGIPSNDINDIFLLFNRMDNVKGIEGSGVGLAIVKRIADKHNATIWVESEVGVGSTFFVAFERAGL